MDFGLLDGLWVMADGVDLTPRARSSGKRGHRRCLIACFEQMRQEVGLRRSWVAAMNEQALATARREMAETLRRSLAPRPGLDHR